MKKSGQPISVTHPLVAAEAHPTKNTNPTRTIDTLTAGSNKSLIWVCQIDPRHNYSMAVYNRTKDKPNGCPYCANKLLLHEESLAALRPDLAEEWFQPFNGKWSPAKVKPNSRGQFWWKCPKGPDHIWRDSVYARNKGKRCFRCSSISMTHPQVAAEAHPTKNTDPTRTIYTLRYGSNKKLVWSCQVGPHHDYEMAVCERTIRGRGCSYCSHSRLATEQSLAFDNAALAEQWFQPLNDLTPAEVFPETDDLYWWKCRKGIDHIWEATVSSRNNKNKPRGCPFCAGYQPSVTNSVRIHYPNLVGEWHPVLNEKSINEYASGSHESVHWVCKECAHIWEAKIVTRTLGHGCRKCAYEKLAQEKLPQQSRPEIALAYELFEVLDMGRHDTIEDIEGKQHRYYYVPDDVKYDRKMKTDGRTREADIILRQYNVVIEYDGARYHSGKEVKDREKTAAFEKAGFQMIRVREEGLDLLSPLDIRVPKKHNKRTMKKMVNDVLLRIQEVSGEEFEGLDSYMSEPELMTAAQSEWEYRRQPRVIKRRFRAVR